MATVLLAHQSHRWSMKRPAVIHSHSSSSANAAELFPPEAMRTESGLEKMALSSNSGPRPSLFNSLYLSSEETLSPGDPGTGDSDSVESPDDDDWASLYDLCPDEKEKEFRVVTINACPGRPRIVNVPASPERTTRNLARQAQKNMSSVSLDSPLPSPLVPESKRSLAKNLLRRTDRGRELKVSTKLVKSPRRSPYNLQLDTRAAASMASLPYVDNASHHRNANFGIMAQSATEAAQSPSESSSTYSERLSTSLGMYDTSPDIDGESYTSVSTPDEYQDTKRRDTPWPSASAPAVSTMRMGAESLATTHMRGYASKNASSISLARTQAPFQATNFLDHDPYRNDPSDSPRKLQRSRLRNIGHSISLGRSKSKRSAHAAPDNTFHDAEIPSSNPPPIPPLSPSRQYDRRASISGVTALATRIAQSPSSSASSSTSIKPSRSIKRAATIGRQIAQQNAANNAASAERRTPEVTIGRTRIKLVPRGADERERPLMMPAWEGRR